MERPSNILRRLEARGEIRGGRFVSGFGGEQYALPEAVESLREMRLPTQDEEVKVAAADPMNLVGVVVPGVRVPAVPGRFLQFCRGVVVQTPDTPPDLSHGETEIEPALEPFDAAALALF